jgi:hypothetical protein
MPRHNVFTEIDSKSYAAIVKNGYLSEVLLALLVDPLEAEDVADSIRGRSETAIKLEVNGRSFLAPISLEDFESLPSKDAFEKLKITLSQWVKTIEGAGSAVKTLAMWDRVFGVWCACAVAREALLFVPKSELRPLRAIEAAEAWVLGMVTSAQVDLAIADAFAASGDASRADDVAASDAASAAAHAANIAIAASASSVYASAVYAVAYAAIDAADDAADADVVWEDARNAELVRFRHVVANACLTFPG